MRGRPTTTASGPHDPGGEASQPRIFAYGPLDLASAALPPAGYGRRWRGRLGARPLSHPTPHTPHHHLALPRGAGRGQHAVGRGAGATRCRATRRARSAAAPGGIDVAHTRARARDPHTPSLPPSLPRSLPPSLAPSLPSSLSLTPSLPPSLCLPLPIPSPREVVKCVCACLASPARPVCVCARARARSVSVGEHHLGHAVFAGVCVSVRACVCVCVCVCMCVPVGWRRDLCS